jgi:hypothetical protein
MVVFNVAIIILGICCTLLLASLIALVITIIATIIRGIIRKSWCQINTNVSVSLDGGITYSSNFSRIIYKKPIHLKYEISARIGGVLPSSVLYEIPFYIETPSQNMNVNVQEYSGICNSLLVKDIREKKGFKFTMFANKRKTEKIIIVLKCKCKHVDTLFEFKLVFLDKHLERYSKTKTFKIYK